MSNEWKNGQYEGDWWQGGKQAGDEFDKAKKEVRSYLGSQVWITKDGLATLIFTETHKLEEFKAMMIKAEYDKYEVERSTSTETHVHVPISWLTKAAPQWRCTTDQVNRGEALEELKKLSSKLGDNGWHVVYDESDNISRSMLFCNTPNEYRKRVSLIEKAGIHITSTPTNWRFITVNTSDLAKEGVFIHNPESLEKQGVFFAENIVKNSSPLTR